MIITLLIDLLLLLLLLLSKCVLSLYRRSFNIKYVTILSDSSLYKFWWENVVKLGDHDNDLSYLIVPENYKSGQSSCWNGEHHVEQPIKHKLDRLYNLILA